jgi:hypothetical protein
MDRVFVFLSKWTEATLLYCALCRHARSMTEQEAVGQDQQKRNIQNDSDPLAMMSHGLQRTEPARWHNGIGFVAFMGCMAEEKGGLMRRVGLMA